MDILTPKIPCGFWTFISPHFVALDIISTVVLYKLSH
jgi:hypothetical protein